MASGGSKLLVKLPAGPPFGLMQTSELSGQQQDSKPCPSLMLAFSPCSQHTGLLGSAALTEKGFHSVLAPSKSASSSLTCMMKLGLQTWGHTAHFNLTQQWLRSGQLQRLLSMGSCNCSLHQSQALQAMPDAFVLSLQHVLAAYQEPICSFDG